MTTLRSEATYPAIQAAEAKFSQRERGRSYLIQTRQIATQRLEQESKPYEADAARLAEIHLRTYDYEATHYLKNSSQKDERRRLYQEAIAAVDKYLSPEALRFDYAPYFYFKSLFLIRLSDESTSLEQLNHLRVLTPLLDKAMYGHVSGAEDFEGGGIYRLKAMMQSREYYKGIGVLYSPSEALKLINTALKAQAWSDSYDGYMSCENFRLKAELERINSQNYKEASLFHSQTIYIFKSYLEDGIVPESIVSETKDCIENSSQSISQSGFIVRSAVDSDSDHEVTYEVAATFLSNETRKSLVSLEAYCIVYDFFSGPKTVAVREDFPYDGNLHRNQLQSIKLTVSSHSIPCNQFLVVFDNSKISLAYVDVTPAIRKDYQLTHEKFIEETKKQLDRRAIELLNLSSSMSGQAGAKQNMFCLIKKAELKGTDAGVLKEMKTNYLSFFGTRYEKDSFTCPASTTLIEEIRECKADATLSTPFCNSYWRYLVQLKWMLDSLAETKRRLADLSASEAKIKASLEALGDNLQVEVNQSKEVLGDDEEGTDE